MMIATPVDYAALAEQVDLSYVDDSTPGISRRRCGRGFAYLDAAGRVIRDPKVRDRIETLAIPPAWEDVWICLSPDGHLQSTGRDARDRKQYLYHPRWREAADELKHAKMQPFGAAIPRIRKKLFHSLHSPRKATDTDLTIDRASALALALLDHTAVRVGNEEYVRRNGSFGLTTLSSRHVQADDGVRLEFVGKGGKEHSVEVTSPLLQRLVKEYAALQADHLLVYRGADEQLHPLRCSQVNEYLQTMTRGHFTAKDFRTWIASSLVAGRLYRDRAVEKKRQRRQVIREAIDEAAARLGNTKTICRKSYIHPRLLETFEAGTFSQRVPGQTPRSSRWFSSDERVFDRFLEADKRCRRR